MSTEQKNLLAPRADLTRVAQAGSQAAHVTSQAAHVTSQAAHSTSQAGHVTSQAGQVTSQAVAPVENRHRARGEAIQVTLVIVIVVLLDQISKALIESSLTQGQRIPVISSFFDLTLTYNRGAAFGILANVQGWLRPVLLWTAKSLALGLVTYLLFFQYWWDWVGRSALALVCGGALGNAIDRIHAGFVTDFLLVYYHDYYWPAFNIADSAICIGIVLLLFRPPRGASADPVVGGTVGAQVIEDGATLSGSSGMKQ